MTPEEAREMLFNFERYSIDADWKDELIVAVDAAEARGYRRGLERAREIAATSDGVDAICARSVVYRIDKELRK